jgi:hypothetical protein
VRSDCLLTANPWEQVATLIAKAVSAGVLVAMAANGDDERRLQSSGMHDPDTAAAANAG